MTDDAVVDFCLQEDVHSGEEGGAASKEKNGELKLYKGSFTKDLFKRLVEASAVSVRTQPLRIVVSPVRFEDEDLRDFAQHLSYRQRAPWSTQFRVYDFPGMQQGEIAAMDVQIVLDPHNRLELVRAQRPNALFLDSDE